MSSFKTNGSFKVTIGVTGQAVILAPTQIANRADVQAFPGNAGNIIVGDNQIANDQSKGGMLLAPGDTYDIELIRDLSQIYVNGTSGDSVSVNWWIGDRN